MTGGICQVRVPIKHLINTESKCLHTVESVQIATANLEEQLRAVKFLNAPKPMNIDNVVMADYCESIDKNTESVNCIAPSMFNCVGSISRENCKPKSNSTDDTSVVILISIQFMHNFTHIHNCSVFFVANEVNSVDIDTLERVIQTISVRYIDVNDTFYRSKAQTVSGNLGYLSHKPMIMTKYIPANESSSESTDGGEMVLAYFHVNGTDHYNDEYFMKIPAVNENNDCVIDNNTYETIKFGENSINKCHVRLLIDDSRPETSTGNSTVDPTILRAANRNISIICQSFQRQIFQRILHRLDQSNVNSTVYDDFNVQISQLGNPKNESKLWIKLEAIRSQMNLAQITGDFDSKDNEKEFVCRNIVLNVRYEFYYAVVMLGGRANQVMVKKATVEFGPRLVLNFKLDEELRVPAYVDVMFHDLTGHSSGVSGLKMLSCSIYLAIALISVALVEF